MTQKIIYLVGAFGCGKTTAVTNLTLKKWDEGEADYLTESDIFWFLKNPDLYTRQIFYLTTFYYKLINKLGILDKNGTLFVDGHPMLSIMYAETFFQLENGATFNMRQILDINRLHWRLWDYSRKYFEGIEQTIIYINLPLDQHLKLVKKRFEERKFDEEMDIDYLTILRSVIHRQVRTLGEDLYNCNVIEVNNLEDIKNLNL